MSMVALKVTGCLKKSLVALERSSLLLKSQVAMEVTGCYGSQRLLWKFNGCYLKSFAASQCSYRKSMVPMEITFY
jgi:hypothetical protein